MRTTFATDVRNFVITNYLFGQGEALQDSDSFLEQGIIDSTGILELVAHLEETYAIDITEEELIPDNLDSVERIATYLSRKLNHNTVGQPRQEAFLAL